MSNTVIKVEEIGKQYRLGEVGSSTLQEDFKRFWHKIRGREETALPFEAANGAKSGELVWALQDVSFDIKQGEAVGIVGRNGAGKSTLLKILSRVTSPSVGQMKVKGRIASLLEVGTGFHPDLTGRENIFLNGAILGMTKHEIRSKFDEIVAFSGVEKYIDTPVKRYSSGMYVRLAFAVAAHLEPEILIVDEVLAVGDADFQKKCLGKMGDVTRNDGRTILFVSHNMTAIKNLCTKGIFLQKGKVFGTGTAHDIVQDYLKYEVTASLIATWDMPETAPGNEIVRAKRLEIIPENTAPNEPIWPSTPIRIEYEFWLNEENMLTNLSLHLLNPEGDCIFNTHTAAIKLSKGLHKGVCYIPANLLNDNDYSVSIMVIKDMSSMIFNLQNVVSFEVKENRDVNGWHGKWQGYVRPKLNFTLNGINREDAKLNLLY